VHDGTESIEAAGREFYARIYRPAGKPDMKSLRNGLIDYYKFDDLTASSSIHGTHGKLVADETFGQPKQVSGKFDSSIMLKGEQQITLEGFKDPVDSDGRIEQFSISFWARNFGGNGNYRIGKGKGSPITEADGTSLDTWFWSTQANRLGWDVRGFGLNVGLTGAVLKDGEPRTFSGFSPTGFAGDGIDWIHIVFVYDGKNGDMKIYRNGELCSYKRILDPKLDTSKHAKRMDGPVGVPISPIHAAKDVPLTVGGELIASSEFQCYDELAIWSRPITEEEVKKLYNSGAGSEIPVD